LIGEDSVQELGSELDRLKQSAESLPERENRGTADQLLEDIEEEDLPELDLDEEGEVRASSSGRNREKVFNNGDRNSLS